MSPDSDQPSDFWKNALESKMASLRREASENGGVIAPDSVRLLKDLDTLRQIEQALVPSVQPRRWPIVLAFFLTLVIVSVLFFVHVRSTRINLDATVSEITFTVTAPTRFSPPRGLSRVKISGVLADPQSSWSCSAPEGASAFIFQAGTGNVERAIVSVDNLSLPEGTILTAASPGDSFRENLKLTFPKDVRGPSIVFSAVGSAQLQNGNCKIMHSASPFDRITLHPSEKTIDMSFEPLGEEIPVPVDIPASTVSLDRVITESSPVRDPGFAHRRSTIFSGSLFFDSVGSREKKLREGERIEFSGFRGFVFVLQPQRDRLRIRLAGEVSDIRSADTNSTLKPTVFDYLTANHGLATLWTGVIYCFGLVLTVLRFWRPTLQ